MSTERITIYNRLKFDRGMSNMLFTLFNDIYYLL